MERRRPETTAKAIEIQREIETASSQTGYTHNAYFDLEKHMADSYTARVKLMPFAEKLSQKHAFRHLYLAGWMFAESALAIDDAPVDERHEIVKSARECWSQAHALALDKDSRREKYQDIPSETTLRCELSMSTLGIIDAIVSGNASEEAREDLYKNMLGIAAKTCESYGDMDNSPYGTVYLGFAHEVNTMLIINRLRSTSLIAIPSLPRCGDGNGIDYNLTHDVQVLNTSWGEIRHIQPIEVKATPQGYHYDRYTAAIVGGTVHLHPQHQRDPSYVTNLLLEEYAQTANEHEIAILNQATNKVVHAIRHGYHGTEQCREVETCSMYGLERR